MFHHLDLPKVARCDYSGDIEPSLAETNQSPLKLPTGCHWQADSDLTNLAYRVRDVLQKQQLILSQLELDQPLSI